MPRLNAEKKQQLRAQFKKFDKSGDGMLDLKEMSVLLRRGNPNLTDVQLRTLFSGADVNGDGNIDFDEFVDYLYSGSAGAGDNEEPAPPEAPEDVRSVFQTFAGGAAMDGTKFAKLCRDCQLVGANLAARDVDTIFAKVVPKGKRALQFQEFLKALVIIAQKKGMDIQELYGQVGDAAPITKGTKSEAVRFHDDKSTYTGVKALRPTLDPEEPRGRAKLGEGAGARTSSKSPMQRPGGGERVPSKSPSEPRLAPGPVARAATPADEPAVPPVPRDDEPDWNELTKAFFGYAGKSDDLDGREFAKLCGDCGLYDRKFTNRDVDIIFRKVLFKNERRIIFGQFVDALKLVAQKKDVAPYFVHNAVLKSGGGGPVLKGTRADAVRFHDDKSTYTGTKAVH